MGDQSKNFLNKDNVELIWEVISDENIFEPGKNHQDIHDYFIEQLRLFTQRNGKSSDLVEMNKKFIENFLQKIKQPHQQQQPLANQFVTAQDIQTERKNKFDVELHQKRSEFDSAMNITIPEKPTFTDNVKDEPIGNNMEMLIAQTLAQRNLELENIHSANQLQSTDQMRQFLKPQETSIKSEKTPFTELKKKTNTTPEQREIKYIQIGETVDEPFDTTSIIDLNERENNSTTFNVQENAETRKKHITWSNMILDVSDNVKPTTNTNVNIFSRLKKVSEPKNIQDQITELTDRFNSIEEKMDFILKKIENM